jgi:hypothetical protein
MGGYFHVSSEHRRDRWQVKVKAKVLRDASAERMDYHEGRAKWWAEQREKAEGQIRSGGITVRHHLTNSGNRAEAVVDPGLSGRLAECEQKIREHQDAVNRFRAYRAFFELSGEAEHELTADDVLYFALADSDDGVESVSFNPV